MNPPGCMYLYADNHDASFLFKNHVGRASNLATSQYCMFSSSELNLTNCVSSCPYMYVYTLDIRVTKNGINIYLCRCNGSYYYVRKIFCPDFFSSLFKIKMKIFLHRNEVWKYYYKVKITAKIFSHAWYPF